MPQRSPILVALLFAATLAVNAVVAFWMATQTSGLLLGMLFYALTFAQLNVLAVWAVFSRSRMGWRWVAPVAGGLAFAAVWSVVTLLGPNGPPPQISNLAFLMTLSGFFWLHVTAAMGLLWMLKSMGVLSTHRDSAVDFRWQFSIGNLLVLTTVGCVLLTLFVANELLQSGVGYILELVAINVLLLAAVAFGSSRSWHWLLRLALSAAAAIVIGLISKAFVRNMPGFDFATYSLIQALVTCAWLELGPILPWRESAIATVADEPPAKPALFQPEP